MAGKFPCPWMSLQKGTMFLAIVDAVLSSAVIIFDTMFFVIFWVYSNDDLKRTWIVVAFSAKVIACLIQIVVAIYLRRSANNNEYKGCLRWLFSAPVLSIATVVGFGIIGLLFKLYEIVLVFAFIRQLKCEPIAPHDVADSKV